jgi:hypothetical protein
VGADREVRAPGVGLRGGNGVGNVEQAGFRHGASLATSGIQLKPEVWDANSPRR